MQYNALGCFLSLTLWCSFSAEIQGTTVIRAAIDIGMGGPKLQVAEVDPTTSKIVKMLHSQRFFVNFYDSISQSNSAELSSEIRTLGLKAVCSAMDIAKSFKAERVVAVATAAFRAASNGSDFANEILNETGLQVHIVNQDLEAKLAFQAAHSKLDIDTEHLVMWDIGGGSTQFISALTDGNCLIDCSEQGAGLFKDFIIETVQRRDLKEVASPNPMSVEDIGHALAHARNLSGKVNRVLKEKVGQPSTVVVGAGSVFGYGIQGILGGKNPFSIEDLTKVVDALPGKTDEDLGGEYACVEGSNPVLVLGFMQHLNIKQMHIVNINNADGALIYEPFWK